MEALLPFGWLVLLVSMMWNNSVGQKVDVQCGLSWIQVRIKAIIYDKLYARPDEVFLGEKCPVTKDLNESYEFFYSVSQCGIETTTLPGNTIQHKTKIVYISTTLNNQIEIPVSCLSHIQVTLAEEVQRKENFLKTAFNLESKGKKKFASLGKREGEEICFSRWLRNLNMYHWIIPLLIK